MSGQILIWCKVPEILYYYFVNGSVYSNCLFTVHGTNAHMGEVNGAMHIYTSFGSGSICLSMISLSSHVFTAQYSEL